MTDALRKIAETAKARRDGDDDLRTWYGIPKPGAFVGEHTGFIVIEPSTVLALLDIADAAQEIASDDYLEQPGPYAQGIRRDEAVELTEALHRFHEVSR
jgi:hypothetical protein